MEKDNEINVNGGSYDFGARIYASSLGRWLSLDFLGQFYSNYVISNNNPIFHVDVDGNWVPSVTINGAIIITAEKGDTYNSFIKFFGSKEIALLYMPKQTIVAMSKKPDEIVAAGGFYYFNMDNKFSKTMADAKKIKGEMVFGLLESTLSNQGYFGDNYNCFYMVKKLTTENKIGNWRAGKRIVGGEIAGPTIYADEFKKWWKSSTLSILSPNSKFGSTILTFGNSHAFIFFGKDNAGNSYTFTKNGDKVAPTNMKVYEFDGGDNDYGGSTYGKPREMPEGSDETEKEKNNSKGGWYKPI